MLHICLLAADFFLLFPSFSSFSSSLDVPIAAHGTFILNRDERVRVLSVSTVVYTHTLGYQEMNCITIQMSMAMEFCATLDQWDQVTVICQSNERNKPYVIKITGRGWLEFGAMNLFAARIGGKTFWLKQS